MTVPLLHTTFLVFSLYGLDLIPVENIYALSLLSFLAMTIALTLGPAHVIFRNQLPPASWTRIRRVLGIWSAGWITAHLWLLWRHNYEFKLSAATRGGAAHGWAEFIILHAAFLYILLMGLTSNDLATRLLGPIWKRFHRGIYFLYPAIAAAGVYEIVRFEISTGLAAVTALMGAAVPALQLIARLRYRRSRSASP